MEEQEKPKSYSLKELLYRMIIGRKVDTGMKNRLTLDVSETELKDLINNTVDYKLRNL